METMPANKISSYIIRSQEEEMKRIALELHEGVGQTLYSIFTGLKVIESGITQPNAKSYVQDMALLLEKTIREVQLLSVELHPPTLSTLGLLAAIKSYAKLYTSTFGIIVDIESKGIEVPIPEYQNIALFRVCQEALANIARYADISYAKIQFNWLDSLLKIDISDSGKGFNVDENIDITSGLAAMKERMYLVGGNCMISSKLGAGTLITITLPI